MFELICERDYKERLLLRKMIYLQHTISLNETLKRITMDSRSLELFLHLSNSLHFGQTSQALHVSPSALTRTIQQLEEKLGTTLFDRDNRTVTLTRAGKRFQQYAAESLMQLQTLKNDILQEQEVLQGEISIYCSVTASYSFLHNTLSDFRHTYPKIRIVLHTGDPEDAIDHIQNGQEDIAISSCPADYPKHLAFKRLINTPLVMIAANSQSTRENLWSDLPFILPEKGFVRNEINQWFDKANIKPAIYAQVSGNEAIVSMVSLGFGLGIVPEIVLENSPLASEVKIISHQRQLPSIDLGFFAQEKNLSKPIIKAAWDTLTT